MKILFFTDSHIKGYAPAKREDVYYNSLLDKLTWIKDFANENNVDYVLHGGDLFDTAKVSNKIFGEVATILLGFDKKVNIVPGNHDLYGRNLETLEHTSLGNLYSADVVNILYKDKGKIALEKDGVKVNLTGQEYYDGIDTGVNADYTVDREDDDSIELLLIHSMLLDKDFFPGVPHTNLYNLKSNADLVLSGHYHADRYMIENNDTLFIKPRSVARIEASEHNYEHLPEVVLLEINGKDDYKAEFHEISNALPGNEIFNIESIQEEKDNSIHLDQFKASVEEVDVMDNESVFETLKQVMDEMGIEDENINDDVYDYSVKLLTDAEKEVAEDELDGFIKSKELVTIDSMVIKNFQSHKYSEINFLDKSLNSITGSSDSGKTSILRAIGWVL